MPKTPKGIFSDKLSFMEQAEAILKNSYGSAENWLLRQILGEVLPELDIEDGQIKSTNSNITIFTSKLNKVMNDLRVGRNRRIVNSILKDMGRISKYNSSYFALSSDVATDIFNNSRSRVETIMQKSLGFNPDGTIRANSFLDSISSVDSINETIRETAIRQIQGGGTIENFTAELSESILTNENGLGILNKNYGTVVNDRYAQYDRAESKSFADELEMQAFIYSGGKVRDTREFCCKRNGLVFTRDEAQHWSSLRWTGKNSGYTPLIDMGGYNCRHSPRWISNRVALRRRPDLMLDENGKLVSKTRTTGPKLNPC